QQKLVADGYVSAQDAVDAPNKGVATTTIYYRDDQNAAQNKSNATKIAKKYFGKAPVQKLDTSLQGVVPDTATVVVLVGQDYANTLVGQWASRRRGGGRARRPGRAGRRAS